MKTKLQTPSAGAYLLVECLVYIAVFAVVLELAVAAYYHVEENNRNLSRNAADILRTVKAGEVWREDIRTASGPVQFAEAEGGSELRIPHPGGVVRYSFREAAVWRQANEQAPWQEVLPKVLSSRVTREPRQFVTAWRWEVELQSPQKVARVKPLFSFEAAVKESKP